MRITSSQSQRPSGKKNPARWTCAAALCWVGFLGCTPEGTLPEEQELAAQSHALVADNGLSTNGLSTNGLSTNGLSTNGLSSSDFHSWFKQDPAQSHSVMSYLILCAVPSGESRTYLQPDTGVSYTWRGHLGLARSWASGRLATREEMQVVSACMAAHVNKYRASVSISVLGLDGAGATIGYTSQELQQYSEREACFFGNLFKDQGVFASNDGLTLDSNESTTRVCGLAGANGASQCEPILYVGTCAQYCKKDSTGTFYTSCTYGGITFRPLTTRIQPKDIYTCGDGVCQLTESCGSGATASSCALDCGPCA